MNQRMAPSNLAKKGVSKIAYQAACWIGDRITDWTGYAAMRVSLEHAKAPREVTLNLPGYMQLNSYCCGAVTVAMVVRFFRPQMSFGRIYATVDPSPEYGAGRACVGR